MTDVVQYTPQQELVQQVRSEQFRSEVALALPENVTPERFIRVAITALQANPGIAELERTSVHRALLQAAAMGLMPDNREAAIVPFKGKAQLIPMIAGFRKIAADYGWTIYTSVVFEHDEFRYEQGLDIVFKHVPVRPGADRGDPIAAYAVGKHADGRRELEVLTVAEIEKIRGTSQTGSREDSPWSQWWEQMAEKSAGKRLFKKLPLSDDDKRVRIVREIPDAVDALYGNGAVDRATGEILPASGGPAAGAGTEAPLDPQQAAEPVSPAEGDTAPLDATPSGSAVPEDDEPSLDEAEPTEAEQLATFGALKPPTGENKDKTLDEIAALGEKGWKWLAWACEDKRPWFRDGHPHAEFGVAVREYVALRTKQEQS